MSQGYCQGGFGLHSPVRYRNRGQVSVRHSSMSSKLASLTLNVVYVTNVVVTKRSKIIAVLTLNRERERERERVSVKLSLSCGYRILQKSISLQGTFCRNPLRSYRHVTFSTGRQRSHH